MKQQPRGIRNNNPGNIRWRDPWQGLVGESARNDPAFCQFSDPTWGIRALARTLITYQDKYNITTVRDIINRWAPPIENATQAYVDAVCHNAGFLENQALDLHQYEFVRPLVEAIIRHECGAGPLKTLNSWYPDNVIEVALQRAGVVKTAPVVAKVPMTKEVIGATATAGLGVAQVLDALPAFLSALGESQADLTSGSTVRVLIGLLTVATSTFVTWSQTRKHQLGVVT